MVGCQGSEDGLFCSREEEVGTSEGGVAFLAGKGWLDSRGVVQGG